MKFSCIIRSYNPNPIWLTKSVVSALGLFDELLVVDDGSYIPVTESISITNILKVVRHDTNLGICEARNTGVVETTGDIICWLDDDDYFDLNGVVRLKQYILANPDSDIWHFHVQFFNESNDIYGVNPNLDSIYFHNPIPGISWHTRKLWEELGGYQYLQGEDWEFFFRARLNNKKFNYFPEVVYHANRRSDSTSMSYVGPTFNKIRHEILKKNGVTY